MFESVSSDDEVWKRAVELLTKMKLANRLNHRPSELSGGEQQRVAIARALLNKPKLLLADEPTGNIDSDSGRQIMLLFQDLKKEGTTLIVATHDLEVAGYADRILTMKDGKLIEGEI
jgi:ABC-type lipoprotein export system ATPase subunit